MKNIILRLKNIEFKEHLDEIQLALLYDGKLSQPEREEVFRHLSQCRRCRDVLRVASEMREMERLKPANTIAYLKPFVPLAAGVVLFLGVPVLDKPSSDITFKGIGSEKNIFETSTEYWEKLFDHYFGNRP